ncbi:6925_t:CDS:2 [Ambispora gerdemannii]|uniref:Reticulon-like protein n=1 Tax=Ambispora gerdemannii TaxID=144530 RepID=A0A9N9DZK8_9GLOM|nr:6925_t:CDS:2 [Ambispora gerdemannii]
MHDLEIKEMDNTEDIVRAPQAPSHSETLQNGSTKNQDRSMDSKFDDPKPYKTDGNSSSPVPVLPVPILEQHRTEKETETASPNEGKTYSPERIQRTLNSVNTQARYLVEWENTVHSGSALSAVLVFLFFTANYSLFNTFCFLAIVLIGADWAYVFAAKQFKTLFNQDAVNPHDKYIRNPPHISRELAREYTDLWVDIINFVLAETTKIVFVEDPYRSIKYVTIFYLTWTVASWFSFRFLIGAAAVLAFAVPKLYRRNKELVDKHLNQGYEVVRDNVNKGVNVSYQYATPYIGKMKNFAASNGFGMKKKE